MPRRAAMWPTELSDHKSFTQLSALAQRLFQYLWLHADLNAGGFIAYQPAVWANQAPDLTVDSVNASVDEMTRRKVAAVDPSTGELLVRGFIQYDSSKKPNVYVDAMRAVQAARSPRLRQIAWEDIQRIGLPPIDRRKDTDKALAAYDKLEREREKAYQELKVRIGGTVREPSSNRSGTVREPPSEYEPVSESEYGAAGDGSRACPCGRGYPVMDGKRCGVCLGEGIARGAR